MQSKKAQFLSTWMGKAVFFLALLVVLLIIIGIFSGKIFEWLGSFWDALRFG